VGVKFLLTMAKLKESSVKADGDNMLQPGRFQGVSEFRQT
jgi:hypothetical protein